MDQKAFFPQPSLIAAIVTVIILISESSITGNHTDDEGIREHTSVGIPIDAFHHLVSFLSLFQNTILLEKFLEKKSL